MKVLWLQGEEVPSRLNCNFVYKVRGTSSKFSTDIATGAKSTVVPPKYSHWGSGIYGDGYDFSLMVSNLSHNQDNHVAAGSLSIFGLGEVLNCDITFRSNSSMSVVLSDLLNDEQKREFDVNASIFTWFLKLDQPTQRLLGVFSGL